MATNLEVSVNAISDDFVPPVNHFDKANILNTLNGVASVNECHSIC